MVLFFWPLKQKSITWHWDKQRTDGICLVFFTKAAILKTALFYGYDKGALRWLLPPVVVFKNAAVSVKTLAFVVS